ncbi:MAG: M48 family metalloprotease [Clostridium sp.]
MPEYRIGNEAIAYQMNSKLKSRLIDAVHKLRSVGVYTAEGVNASGIMQAIKEETGIDIRVKCDMTPLVNAYVYVPSLDRNNPLIPNFMRGWQSNTDLEQVLNFTNGKFNGIIDRKNARVEGTFSKMSVPLYITRGLLENTERFSDAEVAAIVSHEIGHVFYYFECLIELVGINYAALYTTQKVLKTGRDVDRVKLLTAYEKAVDATLEDKETICNSESAESIFIHLVSDTVKQRRSAEGDEMYTLRGFEFVSDQFATRHGFGAELGTGLAKIYQMYGSSSTRSTLSHILINVFGTVIVLASLVYLAVSGFALFSLLSAVLIVGCNPEFKIYDDPEERLNRIRNEMVGSLKQADTDARDAIVSNIKVLDEALATLKDKPDVLEAIWHYLIPTGRKIKASREFQQTLEKLMNNDLFVAKAQLDSF